MGTCTTRSDGIPRDWTYGLNEVATTPTARAPLVAHRSAAVVALATTPPPAIPGLARRRAHEVLEEDPVGRPEPSAKQPGEHPAGQGRNDPQDGVRALRPSRCQERRETERRLVQRPPEGILARRDVVCRTDQTDLAHRLFATRFRGVPGAIRQPG